MCVVAGVTILAWTLWQAEKAEMAKEAAANDADGQRVSDP